MKSETYATRWSLISICSLLARLCLAQTPAEAPPLARPALFGTGAPEGTVALFGHPFARGMFRPGENVTLRRADTGAPLRTQVNPVTSWPDGSVKVALLAVETPALEKGATQECVLVKSPAQDAAPLDLAAALKGRTATLTITPTNGAPWTFDLLAAALDPANKDRWHNGPLAVSTRVDARVPSNVVGATSLRLSADVIVTKDGILEIDSSLANDAIRIVGGGPATYGYKVTLDGQDIYQQAPFTQIRYTAWVRRNVRAKAGSKPERPMVRPDYDVLVKSGFTLPMDRGLPSRDFEGYVTRTIAKWAANANDPYPAWGIDREAGNVGGRQEIGYHTYAGMCWIKSGDPAAQFLANRQLEVGMSRPQNIWDAELGRWVNSVDWPKLTFDAPWVNACPLGVPREKANALPKGEGLGAGGNWKIHVGVDHAHNGDYWTTPAVLGGRRMAFDGMAMNACWSPLGQYRKRNKDGTAAAAPDFKTGIGWAPTPGGPQTRSYAWSLRDVSRAAAFLPDNYPNRNFFTQNALAYINSYGADLEQLKAERGELGGWVAHTGGRKNASFMNSFVMYAILDALNLGVAGEHGLPCLEYFASFRANAFNSPEFNWRNATGNSVIVGDGTNLFTTWKQSQAAHVAAKSDIDPEWSKSWPGEGDWQRNVLAGLAMTRDTQVPLELRVKAMNGVVLYRSERPHGQDGWPRITPTAFFGSFENLNSLCPHGSTWRWDVPPVVRAGQGFKMADKTESGIVGLIITDGGLPRASKPEGMDAFTIVSQPEGNPFELTRGGGLKLVGKAPALPAKVEVYATAWDNDGKEYRGPTVAVTVFP